MYLDRKKYRILTFTTLLFLVTSCTVLHISPPSPFVQTILVLPVKATNTSMSRVYGYYYGYEIVNATDKKLAYEAVFKLPNENGVLLVDTLPPGNYIVSKIFTLPISRGTEAIKNKYREMHHEFKLESGKITVLQIELEVSVVNDPNFYGTTFSRKKINTVYQSQKDEILAKLRDLENFDKWEVLSWKVLNVDSNLNEQPVLDTDIADTDVPDTGIAGTYTSKIIGPMFSILDKKNMINFKQRGNDIIGTDASLKQIITGTRKGDTITFRSIGGVTGVWKVNSDDTRLEGTWEATNGTSGKWILTKIE